MRSWCRIFFLFLLSVGGGLFAQESKPLVIYTLKGPSGAGMVQLFETPPQLPGFNVRMEALAQADLMAAKIINGEALIGVLPPNAAAKLASSGKRIQIAAVLGNGMLSLLTNDPSIKKIEDLKGKEVNCAGQGATPEFVFRRILAAKGLEAGKDVALNFSMGYAELAGALVAGRITTALLPEPFASQARAGKADLRPAGDIQKEWARIDTKNGANYPMTVLVVDAAFAAANRAAMTILLDSVQRSQVWVTAHPHEAALLTEKHNFGLRAAVIEQAIPQSNYVFIPAFKARPALEALYNVFLTFEPVSIGGKLPPASFYYR